MKKLNIFIANNSRPLAWVVVVLTAAWYISGLLLIDYINPVAFLVIYVPIGLLLVWFAQKW